MKKLALHWKIIIGLVLGIAWAFAASYLGWNDFTRSWINPFGVIFIRMLKFIAVPLVLFSIIAGIGDLKDISKLGRMGAKTLGLYLVTTVVAISVGLLLVNIVKPGAFVDDNTRIKNRLSYETWAMDEEIAIKDGLFFTGDPQYAEYLSEAQQAASELGKDPNATSRIETAKKSRDNGPLQFLIDMVPENVLF